MTKKLNLFFAQLKYHTLFIGILLVAAALRFYRIGDFMTYLGDEGRDDVVVYNILHGHLTLLGPTSSVGGFFLGPIYYYFMAPFLLLFNYDPVGPAIMVALFSLATVWLLYYIGTEFFNKRAGSIAAGFYAVSTLVIIYSRSSWNPNPVPFFTLLLLYVLYKAVTKNKQTLFLLSGFLLGILLQLHYLATFVGVIIGIYIVFSRLSPKQKLHGPIFIQILKEYGLVFIGFILGWLPLLVFEARHNFRNLINIYLFIFHSQGTGVGENFIATIGDVFFRLFGRLLTTYPSSQNAHLYSSSQLSLWYVFTLLIAFTAILFLLKHNNKQQKLLLFSWLIIGILLFGFYKKAIYDYYIGFLFPLPFLMVGNAFSKIIDMKSTIFRYGGIFAVVLLLVLNLVNSPTFTEPNRLKEQSKIIADFVLSKTNNQSYNFALLAINNTDFAYRYFFLLKQQNPITIQNFVIDPKRQTVTNQLLVICEDLPCKPEGNPLWEIAGFGQAKIAGKWTIDHVEVYKLIHAK